MIKQIFYGIVALTLINFSFSRGTINLRNFKNANSMAVNYVNAGAFTTSGGSTTVVYIPATANSQYMQTEGSVYGGGLSSNTANADVVSRRG